MDLEISPPEVPKEATRLSIGTLFGHHDTHPVIINLVLLKKFGPVWLTWEPETLWSEISVSFPSPYKKWDLTISEHNKSKIQAVRTLLLASSFWSSWEVFVPVINALGNVVPRFDVLDAPTIARMMAGVDIANAVRRERFMGDVPAFMAACALDEGVCWLPPPLDSANAELAPTTYLCSDCGNMDVLEDDGLCDVCSARYDKAHNLDGKAVDARTRLGYGKQLRVGSRYDWRPVKARYEELAKGPIKDVDLRPDDNTDVQVGKLLVAKEYMELRRRQALEQRGTLGEWCSL